MNYNETNTLMKAFELKRPDAALILLRNKADPNASDYRGLNAVWRAADSNCIACVQVAVKYGLDVNQRNDSGKTVVFRLARGSNPQNRDFLIGLVKLVDVNAIDKGRLDCVRLDTYPRGDQDMST